MMTVFSFRVGSVSLHWACPSWTLDTHAYEPISLMDGGVSAIEGYEKRLFHVALFPYSNMTTILIIVKSLFQDSSKSTTLGFKAIVQV